MSAAIERPTTVRGDLLTLRRAGSQLFSRHRVSSREREDS